MNCRKARKQMIFSLSNDLDPLKQQILQAHLKDCPDCSQIFDDIKKDLEWMASIPGQRPEFDWNRSWKVIQARLSRNAWAREPRIFRIRTMLQAAAALGIFLLGIVIGRHIFSPPAVDLSLQSRELEISRQLIQRHLEETGMALLEYDNRRSLSSDRQIFDLEKQHVSFLLFQNRALQAFLEDSVDSSVIALLRDLEILLYEAANFETASSEAHDFMRTMIKDKDIFFRIRQIGSYQTSKTGKEAKL